MAISPVLRPLAARARLLVAGAVLLAGLSLLTGCKKPAITDPNDPNFIVASKDTWTVTRGDLNKQIDDALAQQHATRAQVPAAQMPKIETQVLRFIVLKKLLLDKAATMQLPDIDKLVDQAIEMTKNSKPGQTLSDADLAQALQAQGMTLDSWKHNLHDMATIQAVLDAAAGNQIEPTEQEVDEIYNSHKDAFNVPPMVRASRVLILVAPTDTPAQKQEKKKEIDAARAMVMKGDDFSKVAAAVSQDRSSAPRGGDMGKFPRGENEPGFDDVAFQTKVNTVSPVFLDSMGYQFIKVTDSSPAGTISLAEARAIIEPKLRDLKKKQVENAYAANLLKTSGVTFYLKDLDPVAELNAEATNAPSAPAPAPSAPADASAPSPAPAPQ